MLFANVMQSIYYSIASLLVLMPPIRSATSAPLYGFRCPFAQIRSRVLRNAPSLSGRARSRFLRVLLIHKTCNIL
jgi:hypothetical protein